MLRKKITKTDESPPAWLEEKTMNETSGGGGGSLQNISIIDTVSAGNKGLLFWRLIKDL